MNIVKSSKVLIYPSMQDSFSLVVLESLAAGIPVAAYDIDALKQNYSSCKAVKLSEQKIDAITKNAISLLNLKDEEYKDLSKTAKKYAKKYSWGKVLEEENNFFMKCVR